MENLERVMIVARNPLTWEKVSAILEPWNLDVICCSTVAEAREVLGCQSPALVFCEGGLRDGTYKDLLETARETHSGARVVVLGGPGKTERSSLALEHGAYAVLRAVAEPVDIEWIAVRAMREENRLRDAFGA
jgi:DNA-binding NtrC family response regulator